MKIFVISLKRAGDRRFFMINQLEKLKVDYEIIDAVDYQKLSEGEFAQLSDQEAIKSNPYLTKGAIACSLSHIKVFKKITEQKISKALVLEDDAILPANLNYLLEALEKEIKEDEIITLSYYGHFSKKTYLSEFNQKVIDEKNKLVYPLDIHHIASSMAYVITCDVAKKMIDKLLPIRVQTDYWGHYYENKAFSSFRCLYPEQIKPALFRSTLDYQNSNTVKSKISAWIRERKILFISAILDKRSRRLIDSKYNFHFSAELPFNKKQLLSKNNSL